MVSEHDSTDIYIESLDRGNTPFLNALEEAALRSDVPIIRRSMQRFLKLMLKMNNPMNILEVGTAVGFSAILMAKYSDENSHITTIEKYEKRIPVAEKNFLESGFSDKITFLKGDAADILHDLAGKISPPGTEAGSRTLASLNQFDMIFMDAAKAQYINFLPDVMTLLKPGGVLITDNVLQDDTVIQSKYTVVRRDRTIHKRMREYLYELMNNEELTTDILKVGDGIAVSVKRSI